MTFEEVQREYDLATEDIRAALKFVADLAEQESFHPLPAVQQACAFSSMQICRDRRRVRSRGMVTKSISPS
jgi:hypothetical protein